MTLFNQHIHLDMAQLHTAGDWLLSSICEWCSVRRLWMNDLDMALSEGTDLGTTGKGNKVRPDRVGIWAPRVRDSWYRMWPNAPCEYLSNSTDTLSKRQEKKNWTECIMHINCGFGQLWSQRLLTDLSVKPRWTFTRASLFKVKVSISRTFCFFSSSSSSL